MRKKTGYAGSKIQPGTIYSSAVLTGVIIHFILPIGTLPRTHEDCFHPVWNRWQERTGSKHFDTQWQNSQNNPENNLKIAKNNLKILKIFDIIFEPVCHSAQYRYLSFFDLLFRYRLNKGGGCRMRGAELAESQAMAECFNNFHKLFLGTTIKIHLFSSTSFVDQL